jgi:hypothetical protein
MSIQLSSYATAQFQDVLIYKNDTIGISSNPLEQHPNIEKIREQLKPSGEVICRNSALWRGYVAYWEIRDNKLFLTKIKNACSDFLSKKKLKEIFGREYKLEKVNANWVNMELVIPQGELLEYIHMGYMSLHEKEVSLQIEKGLLVSETRFTNTNPIKSKYARNPEELGKFIYSNIDWEKIPNLDEKVIVFVEFRTNEKGKVDSAWIYEPEIKNKKYNDEALRVTKSIPIWDVYFRRNKLTLNEQGIQFEFSEKNKLKYGGR